MGWVDGFSYQLPPLITKKTAIVISPLISLMQDQVCEECFPSLLHLIVKLLKCRLFKCSCLPFVLAVSLVVCCIRWL